MTVFVDLLQSNFFNYYVKNRPQSSMRMALRTVYFVFIVAHNMQFYCYFTLYAYMSNFLSP
jgi:hypothetical protein